MVGTKRIKIIKVPMRDEFGYSLIAQGLYYRLHLTPSGKSYQIYTSPDDDELISTFHNPDIARKEFKKLEKIARKKHGVTRAAPLRFEFATYEVVGTANTIFCKKCGNYHTKEVCPFRKVTKDDKSRRRTDSMALFDFASKLNRKTGHSRFFSDKETHLIMMAAQKDEMSRTDLKKLKDQLRIFPAFEAMMWWFKVPGGFAYKSPRLYMIGQRYIMHWVKELSII